MPKVTVAMASYNHAPFVGEAIESVLSQEADDFELIIVDDGSKDETVKEIRKFRDSRLACVALEKNQGACTALRQAIELGTGEYVAILNSDDAFLPGKLKKQIEFLNKHEEVHALFGIPAFIDERGEKLESHQHFYGSVFEQPNRSRHEWLHYFFHKTNALCHPTLMIRRSCYQDLGYYDPRFVRLPDFDFWVRLAFKYNIHILQEELIHFRILGNEANISSPTLEACRQAQWEMTQILPHFLQISSLEEYLKIFPEDEAFLKEHHGQETHLLIPYALAQKAFTLAKEHTDRGLLSSIYKSFGFQILFDLFGHPTFMQQFNLNFHHLTHLTKTHSIFYVEPTLPPVPPLKARARDLVKEAIHKTKTKLYAKLFSR